MVPANDSVKVLEVTRVAPANISPVTAALHSLPITLCDIHWLNSPPIQRLLFYQITNPSPKNAFSDVVLPKLKRSLALALGQYLPLTGTLTWPPSADEPILKINHGDAGVFLTVAVSDADFDRISGYAPRDVTESHPLVPKLTATDTESEIVALQVTAFGNRGFSVGIATHHAILDGKASTTFLKAWAFICRLGEWEDDAADPVSLPPEMTPLFDRTVIRDPDGFKKMFMEKRLSTKTKGLKLEDSKKECYRDGKIRRLRGTFVLSRADIEKLRANVNQWVRHNREQLSGLRISTFVLTCAYIWVCLAKVVEFTGDDTDPRGFFGFAADCRELMDPPVPENYFGNCLGGCGTSCELSDLAGDHGVALAAAALSEGIKKMKEMKFAGAVKLWLATMGDFEEGRLISVFGSPRFGVYSLDFGWGKPRRVEIVSVDTTGAIGLAESREGDGGVEVELVLDHERMKAFAAAFEEGLELGCEELIL